MESQRMKERENFEDISADGKIIFKMYKIGCDVMEWIFLAQDTGKSRAVLNAVMNFLVPQKCEEFLDNLRNCQLLSYHFGACGLLFHLDNAAYGRGHAAGGAVG
jgi:hypothetical protein